MGVQKFDVVVVGGGAAGLSGALVLTRARRRVAVVDGGFPRNAPASQMYGFISREGTSPKRLLALARREVDSYGGHLIDDYVTGVEPRAASAADATLFEVQLGNQAALVARKVLVATGMRDVLPEIEGVQDRWGKDLLHCPYCHGYEVRDQRLVVIGSSDETVEHALLIRQWSADVVILPHEDELNPTNEARLRARGIGIVRGAVARLSVEDDQLSGVEMKNGAHIRASAVFVRPRFVPNDAILTALGCSLDGTGWVDSDDAGRTSVPGVFVAGNVSNPRAQVITSAGEGSAAAIALNAELVKEDVSSDLADYQVSA